MILPWFISSFSETNLHAHGSFHFSLTDDHPKTADLSARLVVLKLSGGERFFRKKFFVRSGLNTLLFEQRLTESS
jgi:hypothetical protein